MEFGLIIDLMFSPDNFIFNTDISNDVISFSIMFFKLLMTTLVLNLPMSDSLYRNCLFRLENSTLSKSINVRDRSFGSCCSIKLLTRAYRAGHPSPPKPTKKTFILLERSILNPLF